MSNNYQANLINLSDGNSGGTTVPTIFEYMNNSLDALVTNLSGSAAPTYIKPYLTWVNTSNNLMYYIEPSSNNSVILHNLSPDNVLEVTSNITLIESNHEQTILVNSSSSSITVTLSTLNNTTDTGYNVCIKKVDDSANTVTIAHANIDGATSLVLREKNDSVFLVYHNSKYYVQSSNLRPLHNVNTVTANYTVVPDNNFNLLLVNNTSAAQIDLPSAASLAKGYSITIKKISGASLDVTLLPNGAETIEENASLVLSTQYQYYTLISDQSTWYISSAG